MEEKRKRKVGLPLLVLAIFCVLGMELLFCRFADPVLFEEITRPAITASKKLWSSTVNSAQHLILLLTPTPEPTVEEPQMAAAKATDAKGNELDPAVTELRVQQGEEILTGGNAEIVYYCQSDETWAERPYGRDNMGDYGCGPTAMAMVISSLTEQDANPEEMAVWAVKNGHWASKSGSYLSLISDSATAFGLKSTAIREFTVDALYQRLSGGGVIMALVREGHFTESGHFILLRGMTLTGEILVADPNSRANSLTLWDPQLILDELSRSRSNGAPLWHITA